MLLEGVIVPAADDKLIVRRITKELNCGGMEDSPFINESVKKKGTKMLGDGINSLLHVMNVKTLKVLKLLLG